MFDPEKLLGGLLRSGFGNRRTGRLLKGGAAMALLGVALEAAEHHMKTTSPPSTSQPRDGGQPPAPPPLAPRPPAPNPGTAVPPPPPNAGPDPVADLSPSARSQGNNPSVLLIRAMIAAAHADGHMDAKERQRILKQWRAVDLNAEEQAFLSRELLSPAALEDIAQGVADRKQALQVYALSRLVMTVDSEAERQYLQGLAQALHLDSQTVDSIENKLRSITSGGRASAKGA